MSIIITAKVELLTTFAAPFSTSMPISCAESVRPENCFMLKCARIPSRMTIEPSTTIPKSMAPRLRRLAETPKMRINIKPKSIANGITEATITPARMSPRKIINTRKTIIAPSMRL